MFRAPDVCVWREREREGERERPLHFKKRTITRTINVVCVSNNEEKIAGIP